MVLSTAIDGDVYKQGCATRAMALSTTMDMAPIPLILWDDIYYCEYADARLILRP